MVVNGPAVTVAVFVADKFVAGVHEYVLPPPAVSERLPLIFMVAVDGVIVIVGLAFTVTLTICEQLLLFV